MTALSVDLRFNFSTLVSYSRIGQSGHRSFLAGTVRVGFKPFSFIRLIRGCWLDSTSPEVQLARVLGRGGRLAAELRLHAVPFGLERCLCSSSTPHSCRPEPLAEQHCPMALPTQWKWSFITTRGIKRIKITSPLHPRSKCRFLLKKLAESMSCGRTEYAEISCRCNGERASLRLESRERFPITD